MQLRCRLAYDTLRIPTTAQSRVLLNRVPTQDASVVQSLREAGAVSLGKLVTKEFATGGPSYDLYYPPARNPWNLERNPGGSSSGAAAGVAAGLCLATVGSDTGGSIRGPAALCGVAGLKPSYGRVSRTGMIPLAPSLDHAGPLAWTVADCALMLQAMAGYDPSDSASADIAVPNFAVGLEEGLSGRRIGIVRHFYEQDLKVNEDVKVALEMAYSVLRDLGAELSDVQLPPLLEFTACGLIILLAEGFTIHEQDLQQHPELYGEACRHEMMLGAFITAADYFQAVRRRHELCAAVAQAMTDVDALVTAASPTAAPKLEQAYQSIAPDRPNLTMPFNVTGLPALAVCCGYDAAGLPLSMQIISKPFDEVMVLRVGHAYERATPWRQYRSRITFA